MNKFLVIFFFSTAATLWPTLARGSSYPRPTRENCFCGGASAIHIVRIFPPVVVQKPDAFGDTARVSLKGLLLPKIFDNTTHQWRDPTGDWFARYRWARQYQFASVSLSTKNHGKSRSAVTIAFQFPQNNLGGIRFRRFITRWDECRHAELLAVGRGVHMVILLRVRRPLTFGGRVWHRKLFRLTATVSARQALVFVRRPALAMRVQSKAHPSLHFPAFRIHGRQRRTLLRFFRRAKLPTRWVPKPPAKPKKVIATTRP